MDLWLTIILFIIELIFISLVLKAAVPYGDFEYTENSYSDDVITYTNGIPNHIHPKDKVKKSKWRTEMTDYGLSCFIVAGLAAACITSIYDIYLGYLVAPLSGAIVFIPFILFAMYINIRKEITFFKFIFKTCANFLHNLGTCFSSKWYDYIGLSLVIVVYLTTLEYFAFYLSQRFF